MTAYIDLLEKRKTVAVEKYKNLAENSTETYQVTNNRSREMMKRIMKEN